MSVTVDLSNYCGIMVWKIRVKVSLNRVLRIGLYGEGHKLGVFKKFYSFFGRQFEDII